MHAIRRKVSEMDDYPPTISPAFAAFSVQVTRSVVVKNNYGDMKI